jgi:hypothetical protein
MAEFKLGSDKIALDGPESTITIQYTDYIPELSKIYVLNDEFLKFRMIALDPEANYVRFFTEKISEKQYKTNLWKIYRNRES